MARLASGGPVKRERKSEAWIDQLPTGKDDLTFYQDKKMAIKPEMDIDDGITTGPQPPYKYMENARGGVVGALARGGRVIMAKKANDNDEDNEDEAPKRKKGGFVPGKAAFGRPDKLARGGAVGGESSCTESVSGANPRKNPYSGSG